MLRSKSKIHLASSRYMLFLTVGLMFNLAVVAASESAPAEATQPGFWQRSKNGLASLRDSIPSRQGLSDFVHGLADKADDAKPDAENNFGKGLPIASTPAAPAGNNPSAAVEEKPKAPVSPTLKKSDRKRNVDPSKAETTPQPAVPTSGSQSAPAVVADDSWNTTYMIGGIAAAAVTVGAIAYWYTVTSWCRAVDKLVVKAQLNPNAILEDLSRILEAWDGSAQQKKIIEYVEERVVLTPELVALLDLYRY